MKPFNLEEALKGAPVKLACGRKAYILYDLSRYPELLKHVDRRPLNGLVMSSCEENDGYPANWLLDGTNSFDQDNIIGMWEEPKQQISIADLPKPFKPEDGEYYFNINGGLIEREEFWDTNKFDIASAERGNCFRTHEDAQAWLNAMKEALE